MRAADTATNKYDGVKVFYRNPDTRMATHNGNHWIVFGAPEDIDGSNMTVTASSGAITVNFYDNSDSPTNTIRRTAGVTGSFLTDGFAVGDSIRLPILQPPGFTQDPTLSRV